MCKTSKILTLICLNLLAIGASASNYSGNREESDNRNILRSNTAYYLDQIRNGATTTPNVGSSQNLPQVTEPSTPQIKIDYNDSYNKTLFSKDDLNVERLITVNGGGTQIRLEVFELGLHFAVKYSL